MSRSQDREQDASVFKYLSEKAQQLDAESGTKRNHTLAVAAARERLFLEQLQQILEQALAKKYYVGERYRPHREKATARVLNLALSDLHFGANLDRREVPLQYGPVEEARRLAEVCKQTAEYKRQYRAETELFVHLLGDIIQNQLHDLRDGAPLAEQMASAIHLLTQALVFLSGQFKQVTVFCTSGNHGRNLNRHPERAVQQKWDSLETVIYAAIKTATAHISNIEVRIPRTPFYTYEVFGMSGFGTHGDTVIKPGFPNRAIQVANVQKQINEINSKLEKKDHHSLFIVGHVHTYSCTKLANGVVFMSNGCLIPTDAYAQSIGIFDTSCCQALWETIPGHMVGDRREIDVSEETDKDASLDKIITPFTGL